MDIQEKTKSVGFSKAAKSHPLARAVLRQLGGGLDAVAMAMEAAEHGGNSGFTGFIYYSDTIAFAKRHRKAIADCVSEMAGDILGDGRSIELVRGFQCFRDDVPTEEGVAMALFGGKPSRPELVQISESVLNALAWFALEEVGRSITDASE